MSKLRLSDLDAKSPHVTDTADYRRAARDMLDTGRGFLVDGKYVDPGRVLVIQHPNFELIDLDFPEDE